MNNLGLNIIEGGYKEGQPIIMKVNVENQISAWQLENRIRQIYKDKYNIEGIKITLVKKDEKKKK